MTSRQNQFLDALIARYTRRTAGSKWHVQTPSGSLHADPRTVSGFHRRWKEMVYPLVVDRSAGARLWDVDGNEYIDLLNGFGPDLFGHSPDVRRPRGRGAVTPRVRGRPAVARWPAKWPSWSAS